MAMSDGWADDDFSEIAPSEGYNDVWAMPADSDQSFIATAQRLFHFLNTSSVE